MQKEAHARIIAIPVLNKRVLKLKKQEIFKKIYVKVLLCFILSQFNTE